MGASLPARDSVVAAMVVEDLGRIGGVVVVGAVVVVFGQALVMVSGMLCRWDGFGVVY
jgi:uncharacterized membrane protein